MRFWIWPLILIVTVFLASGTNPVGAPNITNFDKLAHFLIFGLLAVIVVRCRQPVTWGWVVVSFLVVSGLGGLDEFRQSFTPGRSVEWQDWLADSLGAMVSLLLYKTVPLYSKLLELRFGSNSGQTEATKNNTSS